jgi:hypothetical protein
VTVSAAVTGSAGIEIRIADTGCGIPDDQLERVFEPFHQVENELSRATNGTGLGLPLSRKLVERHGGTLVLESAVAHGTTAILSLPRRAVGLDGLRKVRRRLPNSLISWNDRTACLFILLCYNTAILLRIRPCLFIPPRPL